MCHLLSIRKFVIVLIAACLFAVAEHHHDDFDQHEDCAICALIHDGYNLEEFTPCRSRILDSAIYFTSAARHTKSANFRSSL